MMGVWSWECASAALSASGKTLRLLCIAEKDGMGGYVVGAL